jgi:hypothetical protein
MWDFGQRRGWLALERRNAVILIVLVTVLLTFTSYGVFTSFPEYAPAVQLSTFYEQFQPTSDFLLRTSDGGYVLGVNYMSWPSFFPLEAFFIAKMSANGDIQWSITPGEIRTPPNFTLMDAYQTSDGGYILVGSRNNESGQYLYSEPCLIKLSDNGAPEWNITYYGALSLAFPICVEQTADGGYILGGSRFTVFNGNYTYNMGLLKTDSTGNGQWNTTYPVGLCMFVHQTADGGFVLAGQDNEGRLFLLKTNSTGNPLWEQTYGEASNPGYVSTIATAHGGYVLATVAGGNLVLDKIAGNGTLLWQKTYAGNWAWGDWQFGRDCDIQQTSDGGYVIAGTAEPSNYTASPLLLKVDESGSVQWMKQDFEGGFSYAIVHSVVQSADGGYVLAGVNGVGSPFIVKLAANPTYAPSAQFESLVVMTVLESVALLLLVDAAIRGKINITQASWRQTLMPLPIKVSYDCHEHKNRC